MNSLHKGLFERFLLELFNVLVAQYRANEHYILLDFCQSQRLVSGLQWIKVFGKEITYTWVHNHQLKHRVAVIAQSKHRFPIIFRVKVDFHFVVAANRLLLNLLNWEAKLLYNLGKGKNLWLNCHNHVHLASFKILVDRVAVLEDCAQTNPLSTFLEQQGRRNHIQINAGCKVLLLVKLLSEP